MRIIDSFLKFIGVTKQMTLPTNDPIGYYEKELNKWLTSKQRLAMIEGDRYYEGDHDIKKYKRTAIGENGKLIELDNLPNSRIVNNLYGKIVDQKVNYILSKPLTFESDDKHYNELLLTVFNADFLRRLKNITIDSFNGGICWLYPYFDTDGSFKFQTFRSFEILPFWKDNEHSELESAIRIYTVKAWEGSSEKLIKKVEIFTNDGIQRFILNGSKLETDKSDPFGYYARLGDQGLGWERIPLIPFRSNGREIPLISKCKSLQDAYNIMLSNFSNIMQEDPRNTVLVIKNYDGEKIGDFRHNLAKFGVIKVRSFNGEDAGVNTLNIQVNKDNYESILQLLKKSIIECCMGYDAKDDRIGSNANQINIKSMYNDIDIDSDNLETEFKASFEHLLFFVNSYLATTNKGNYFNKSVKITFNRDTLVNESEVIDNLVKLGVQLPNKLLVGQVPFVDNVQDVIDMLEEEKSQNDIYANVFNEVNHDHSEDIER